MIKNKLVTILKKNTFDKGWALFEPVNLVCHKNYFYNDTLISDVVKQITFANSINIILSEICLPSSIVNEIKWVNKYVKINLIAKSNEIVKRYSEISFSTVKIDSLINFNYIGISGKNNGNYIILDEFISVDESINRCYFDGKDCNENYEFLNDTCNAIIIDSTGENYHSQLIDKIKEKKIHISYVINTKSFNKQNYEKIKESDFDLCISDYTNDGVLLEKNDGDLVGLSLINKQMYISYRVRNSEPYFGKTYKSMFMPDVIDCKLLKDEMYYCFNGVVNRLSISDKKVIKKDVPITEMKDFIDEKFDTTLCEKHNDYSLETKQVEYQFTLIPPKVDKNYTEAHIYDEIHTINLEWNNLQQLKIDKIKREYEACIDEDFGLISLLDKTKSISQQFNCKIEECNYKDYRNWVKETKELYEFYNFNLIDICKKMFNSINEKSLENKFDKFDIEIEDYRKTIADKTDLIEKGIDVLSNKIRIEILTQKINDLLSLKTKFKDSSSSRNDKYLNDFINRCMQLINGDKKVLNDDSLGNIVKPREETKLSKLEMFVDSFLFDIKNYIDNCLNLLYRLEIIDIPEDYQVIEKDNQRYIVIDELEEFDTTKAIREKYNLKCLSRR